MYYSFDLYMLHNYMVIRNIILLEEIFRYTYRYISNIIITVKIKSKWAP